MEQEKRDPHPGGRSGDASEEELGPIGMESATPGPMGAGAMDRSGDMGAGSSDTDEGEADDGGADVVTAGAGGPDAGSPGGMGGARTREGAGTGGRPPGGVSPIQAEED